MADRTFLSTANGNLTQLPANVYVVKGNMIEVRKPLRKPGDAKKPVPYSAEFEPHWGQMPIWADEKTPYQILLAGSQGGKSHIGPLWIDREIHRALGEEPHPAMDYEFAIVAPSLQMQRQAKVGLARMVRYFENKYGWREDTILNKQDWKINLRAVGLPVQIYSGTAERQHRLQGSALRAAWIDEAGLVIDKSVYYITLQRLAGSGRLLVTTTPYLNGAPWLKVLIEEAEAGKPSTMVVRYSSLVNPYWSLEQDNRQREELTKSFYNMMYNAQFEKPQGLVYDECTYIEPFAIPRDWVRIIGIDPTQGGQDEFAAVWIAYDPWEPEVWYVYREFYLPCTPKLRSLDQQRRQPHEMLDMIWAMSVIEEWNDAESCLVPTQGREHISRIFVDPSNPGIRYDVQNLFNQSMVFKADPKLDGIIDMGRMLKTGRLLVFTTLINFQMEQTTYIYPYDQLGDVIGGVPLDRNNHLMDACRYAVRQSNESRSLAEPSFG